MGPSKREESEREKENSREDTKMCVFLLFGRLVRFLCSLGCLSLSREMIGHFRKINYPKY